MSNNLEEELKKRLDDTFLNTLVDAGKTYGWGGDYDEVACFIEWCFELVEKDAPDLTPFDSEE